MDSDLEGLDFEFLQKEGMYIIESRKRFRRQISPNKIITGNLVITHKRDSKNLLLCEANFSFEDRSCIGELELVLVRQVGRTTQ